MNWATAILILVAGFAIYKVANEKGKRKVSQQVQQRQEALDREEANNELQEHRDSNAWDNLNDTITGNGKGKK